MMLKLGLFAAEGGENFNYFNYAVMPPKAATKVMIFLKPF